RLQICLPKPAQHVRSSISHRVIRLYPDSYAGELVGLQATDNRLQSIVASRAASNPNADHTEGKIHIIDKNDEVLRQTLVFLKQPAYRQTTEVHVGLGLCQYQVFAAHASHGC